MSTAELASPAPGRGAPAGGAPARPGRAWLRLLRSELRLIFLRWRNLALLAVLAAIPVLLGIALRALGARAGAAVAAGPAVPRPGRRQRRVPGAAWPLTVMLTLVLPLAVAVVSGDSGGRRGRRTARCATCSPSPPGRTRLLGIKYAAAPGVLPGRVPAGRRSSLVVGAVLFPIGPVTLLSGTTVLAGRRAAAAAPGRPCTWRPAMAALGRDRPGHLDVHRARRSRAIAAILVIAIGQRGGRQRAAVLRSCTRTCPRTGGCRSTGCSARRWPGGAGPRAALVRDLRGHLRRDRLGPVHHRRRHQLSMTASRCHCSAVTSATGAPGPIPARISSLRFPNPVSASILSARAEGWR